MRLHHKVGAYRQVLRSAPGVHCGLHAARQIVIVVDDVHLHSPSRSRRRSRCRIRSCSRSHSHVAVVEVEV